LDCSSDWSQACLKFFQGNVEVAEEDYSSTGPTTAASSQCTGLGVNSEHSCAAQTPEQVFMAAPYADYATRVDANEPVPDVDENPSDAFTEACKRLIFQAQVTMID